SDSHTARTVPWIARGLRAAMVAAISRARSRSCARGTTSDTSPMRSAVSALIRSSFPMRAQRITPPMLTPRASTPIGSGAEPGPTLACGSKKVASSLQMTMPAALRKYWRPPAAMPCTATTSGFHTLWCSFGLSSTPGSKLFHTLSRMNHDGSSVTSSPVQNALSPLACRTTTCTSSSSRIVRQAWATAAAMAPLNALRDSGRSSVSVAMCSDTSSEIVVRSMGSPQSWSARNDDSPGPMGPGLSKAEGRARSDALDDHRRGHAAGRAHGDEAECLVLAFELVEHGAHEQGAGGADRVAEGDGPAVHVDLVAIDVEVPDELLGDHGERLVDLEQVDVVEGEAGLGDDLAGGRAGG